MTGVCHATSAEVSAKRSSAIGSRSIPISVPAGPRQSAIRRAWPPPPKVQSTATSPGRGSVRAISSAASTGICVFVMSSSVATHRCDVGDTVEDVVVVGLVGAPVPDLDALARAGHDDVFVEACVAHQWGRDHQAVGGI